MRVIIVLAGRLAFAVTAMVLANLVLQRINAQMRRGKLK